MRVSPIVVLTTKTIRREITHGLQRVRHNDILLDSSKTFIDLYMRADLYITEINERLYSSGIIKQESKMLFDRYSTYTN